MDRGVELVISRPRRGAANLAGARTERRRRERVWTNPSAEGRMFSGWTIWGSNVPGLFACFYPVGGITLWP